MARLRSYFSTEGFRQAIRVSLAMVIAYYISLSMGWDRPQWAGLAVALCSLATTGDSAVKGLLRILGTMMCGTVAILLAAFFPQDRWAYLLIASLYIAFCAYMMGSTTRWYFWFISGYVMALLAMSGGPEGATLFEIIVLRIQQTTMGFTVYFVVASLLWPPKTAPAFDKTIADLAMAQKGLIILYRDRISDPSFIADDAAEARLRRKVEQISGGLSGKLDSAALDNLDIWFDRKQWRELVTDFEHLTDVLESARIGMRDLEPLPVGDVAPGLVQGNDEVEIRLTEIVRMARGEKPDHSPQEMPKMVDERAAEKLSYFDRSVFISASDKLKQIDEITRRLYTRLAKLRGFDTSGYAKMESSAPQSKALDPDRLVAGLRAFVAIWGILLICIYIPDIPMPPGVVPMVAAAVIQLAIMPFLPLREVAVPGLAATFVAWVFHVFVMPHLHSYVGLGIGLFVVIFASMALLAGPKHAIGRPIMTSFFVMVVLVNTEQSYNPLFAIDYAIAFLMALGVVWLTGLFPVSHLPQPALTWRLRRFFTSAERILQATRIPGEKHLSPRAIRYHLQELRSLPAKIHPWVGLQPAVVEKRVSSADLDGFLEACDSLARRLQDLQSVRARIQAEALRKELRADFRAWRDMLSGMLYELREVSAASMANELRSKHEEKLAKLEARIKETLAKLPPKAISQEETLNMYRLMATYRGVSDAVAFACEKAGEINWDEMMENRF